jgi:hypothetical protein
MSSVAMETEKVPAPGGAPAEEDQLREEFDSADELAEAKPDEAVSRFRKIIADGTGTRLLGHV